MNLRISVLSGRCLHPLGHSSRIPGLPDDQSGATGKEAHGPSRTRIVYASRQRCRYLWEPLRRSCTSRTSPRDRTLTNGFRARRAALLHQGGRCGARSRPDYPPSRRPALRRSLGRGELSPPEFCTVPCAVVMGTTPGGSGASDRNRTRVLLLTRQVHKPACATEANWRGWLDPTCVPASTSHGRTTRHAWNGRRASNPHHQFGRLGLCLLELRPQVISRNTA